MSLNASNASNSSLVTVHHHDNNSNCTVVFSILNASRVLLLPLYIFVLILGYRRWRQQPSLTSTSHSDIFAIHLAVLKVVSTLGMVLYYCGVASSDEWLMLVGRYFTAIIFYGQVFFQILTCVECYLAVVHPVTYRGLRTGRGVWIRNISAGCVWALSFLSTCTILTSDSLLTVVLQICVLCCSFAILSFCSVSILLVLVRPGPGGGGGDRDREQTDQSKHRAFILITAILGILLLSILGLLVPIVVVESQSMQANVRCVVRIAGLFFNLPSEVLVPLMYLHRAGRLDCFRLIG